MKGALLGDDQFAWGSKEDPDAGEQLHDLVALAPPPKRDPLNDWVFKRVMKRKFVLRPFWCGLLKVTESSLLRWTTAATVSVTASVPIASSVVLYVTPGTNLRLALLAVINGLATLFLFIFTDAQPIQIVTLLAAWNAVNIVFVSSNATDST
ncbi:hypothetical protein BFW01_g11883 [Lasiodiplodia theobromae]|nr:hypothetical protein BFW01_g11883 [Lasiodiplodia theobromae]